jgi:hypothetical protein
MRPPANFASLSCSFSRSLPDLDSALVRLIRASMSSCRRRRRRWSCCPYRSRCKPRLPAWRASRSRTSPQDLRRSPFRLFKLRYPQALSCQIQKGEKQTRMTEWLELAPSVPCKSKDLKGGVDEPSHRADVRSSHRYVWGRQKHRGKGAGGPPPARAPPSSPAARRLAQPRSARAKTRARKRGEPRS